MKKMIDYAKREINVGNWITIAIIIFAAGGAHWQLSATEQRLTRHIEQDFTPVETRVDRLQRKMVPQADIDNFVTEQQFNNLQRQNRQDLESLKELMREIQSNTNQRLDYIIERLDD